MATLTYAVHHPGSSYSYPSVDASSREKGPLKGTK
jgi:hypothetical protein